MMIIQKKIKVYKRDNLKESPLMFPVEFTFLVGENSTALFEHFLQEELFGLEKKQAEEIEDNPSNAFIAGLNNVYNDEIFLFLNKQRLSLGLMVEEASELSHILLSKATNPDYYQLFPYVASSDLTMEWFTDTTSQVLGHIMETLAEAEIPFPLTVEYAARYKLVMMNGKKQLIYA